MDSNCNDNDIVDMDQPNQQQQEAPVQQPPAG